MEGNKGSYFSTIGLLFVGKWVDCVTIVGFEGVLEVHFLHYCIILQATCKYHHAPTAYLRCPLLFILHGSLRSLFTLPLLHC
ncbi:hypothetical protein DsansV1_C48g0242891 [Dioscorea sansibarensis]